MRYIHLTPAEKKKLQSLKRHAHHQYTHELHYKKHISRKALFYMKEYGPHSHVSYNIIRESLKVLIFASVLSTLGGVGLQSVSQKITAFLPLLILLPALNDMIGDFGTVASSKISNAIFLGKIKTDGCFKSDFVRSLFNVHLKVAAASAAYISIASFILASLQGFVFVPSIFLQVLGITLIASVFLVTTIFLISFYGGVLIFKRKEDPNNFLIPMTTAVADLGSMAIFALGIFLFF